MGAKVPSEALPQTGLLLRNYFEQFREASPSDVYRWMIPTVQRRLRDTLVPGERREGLIAIISFTVSYWAIVNWFYVLRELGIIELSRSEPTHCLPKNFYRLKSPEMAERIKPGLTQTLYPSRAVGGKRWKRAMREGRIPYGRSPETA